MKKNFIDVIHTYEENLSPNVKRVIIDSIEIIEPEYEKRKNAEKNILELTEEIVKNPKEHRNLFELNKYI